MSDSGKHRAVQSHQNSDGTFELVMKTVEEIPSEAMESEVEYESPTTMDVIPQEGGKGRILIPILGVLALGVLALVGFFVLEGDGSDSIEEIPAVPGFRAYGGQAAPVPERSRAIRPPVKEIEEVEPDAPEEAWPVEEEVQDPVEEVEIEEPPQSGALAPVVPKALLMGKNADSRAIFKRQMGKDTLNPRVNPSMLPGIQNIEKIQRLRRDEGDEELEEAGVETEGDPISESDEEGEIVEEEPEDEDVDAQSEEEGDPAE